MLLRQASPLLSWDLRTASSSLLPPLLLPRGFRSLVDSQPRLLLPSRTIVLRCCVSKRFQDAAAAVVELEEEPAVAVQSEVVDKRAEPPDRVPMDGARLSLGIGSPSLVLLPFGLGSHRMSLGDQAFFLLAFIACTTTIAFTSLVIAAVPTLLAMKRAAISLARLADTAREDLPSTMAAIRLSGMEISDLTLELSDLSQEIADGVTKSAQAVQAAEAGIRQIGALARRQTVSMIQERANLPNISLKPVVVGAAKKTSHVVGQAKKTFMNIISRGIHNSESEDVSDKVEI